MELKLVPENRELLYLFFKGFEYDSDTFENGLISQAYTYSTEWVDEYYEKHVRDDNRRDYLILYDNKPIFQLSLKKIDWNKKTAELAIHVINKKYKGLGIGTEAEKMLIDLASSELGLTKITAQTLITNTRSSHVLEKIGFRLVGVESGFNQYERDL